MISAISNPLVAFPHAVVKQIHKITELFIRYVVNLYNRFFTSPAKPPVQKQLSLLAPPDLSSVNEGSMTERDFWKKLLEDCPSAAQNLPKQFRRDKELCIAALTPTLPNTSTRLGVLMHFDLSDDKEFVLELIGITPHLYLKWNEQPIALLERPDFVDQAIEKGSIQAYAYAPVEIRRDIGRTIRALTVSKEVAQYIPDELKTHSDIAPLLLRLS
jgi:hypothetical protein